jgi:DNA polymerase III subunit gamma/tau
MSVPPRQNLYRKYRPQRFSQLAGQEHITRTIQTAIATNRVSHAYMFSGPRGTGKTSSARLLAKILNCTDLQKTENDQLDCCGECSNCKRIEEMSFMDIVEIDAASNNSVEDIRQMREKVKYRPAEGKNKVYIIDEVHMLSGSAFNAFLKTLEEPPPNVIFILATTDPQKVPATIISRCQCFDFHSVARRVIQKRLQEIVEAERLDGPFPEFELEALGVIAESAEGGFRDALSLLDQIASAALTDLVTAEQVLEMTRRLGHSTLKAVVQAIIDKRPAEVIEAINDLYFRGYEPMTIGKDLLEYLRAAMILCIDSKASKALDLPQEQINEVLVQVKGLDAKYLISAVTRVERLLGTLRSSFQAKILLEAELIRLSLGEEIYSTEAMEKRVDQLEQKVAVLKRLGTNSLSSFRAPPTRVMAPQQPTPILTPPKLGEGANPIRARAPEETRVASLDNTPLAKFRKAVAEVSTICNALLVSARLISAEKGLLRLELAQSFALNKLNDPENLELLNEAAVATFGAGTRVQLEAVSTASMGQPAQMEAKPRSFEEEIQKIDDDTRKKVLAQPEFADAIDVFEGEILEVKQ